MDLFTQEYVHYEGRGELRDVFGNVIKATFSCSVLYDGSIIGELFFSPSDNLSKIDEIIKKVVDSKKSFILKGETKEGYYILINKLYIIKHGRKIDNNGLRLNTKFITLTFNINNHEYKKINLIRYGVLCLNLLYSFTLNTNIGDVKFKKIDSHEKIIEKIKEIKKPCLTAFLEINDQFDKKYLKDKLDKYDVTINKILTLSSLSQGITQNYFIVECYNDNNLIYGKYSYVKKRNQGFTNIIWFPELQEFLEKNLLSYTDELENNIGFSLALDWYLESLITDVIHSNIILLFTSIECLLSHHTEYRNMDVIISTDIFNDFKKNIKKYIKKILKEIKIIKKDRDAIYTKINELNRYSLDYIMNDFLSYYKIGYSDIYKNFKEIKNVRDQIIHKGISIESSQISKIQDKIIVLLQRIFLSLLNYDGYNVWYNRLKDFPHEKFNRDPNGDHL